MSNKRQRTASVTSTSLFVLEQQLESLQAELDHERSLRRLDQRKSQQEAEMLKQQVALAVSEAESSKSALEDLQTSTNQLTAKLRSARDGALQRVRDLQLQLDEAEENHEDDDDVHWKSECHYYQSQLEAANSENTRLQTQVAELSQRPIRAVPVEPPQPEPRVVEEAPPELLKELQRLRIQLAESERKQRQYQRQVQAAERRHTTVTREREQLALQVQTLPALQQAHEKLQREFETMREEYASWKEFGQRLTVAFSSGRNDDNAAGGVPPEVSTVIRKLEKGQQQVKSLENSLAAQQKQTETLEEAIRTHSLQTQQFQEKERQWTTDREEWKQKLENIELQAETFQGQIHIYKREAESLRSLIKTFENLPLGNSAATKQASSALQLSLDSTQKERDLLQKDRDRFSQQVTTLTQAQQEQRQELNRIREKFIKLRDALQQEKEKLVRAEARANQAEALAGSGSFNPDRTRVLHLEETPLIQSLKEEVAVLKRQVEAKGDNPAKHDPDKLNQRLKQNFKEQIALFREGVYLMTGFKVDMLHSNNPQERPTFRVRSLYAEREEDHLLLKWSSSSLDILGTELAKDLAKTPSYEYMNKFHSLPAFLSSVQLSLFEKQTVMM